MLSGRWKKPQDVLCEDIERIQVNTQKDIKNFCSTQFCLKQQVIIDYEHLIPLISYIFFMFLICTRYTV